MEDSRNKLVIKGASEHNLKHVNLELPKGRLVVFTGVSGSGKTSLAFDTLYKEGQRRYLEALSSYARQFIGGLTKPKLEYLGGVSPAISIEQKTAGRNPRSTVATMTETYDYLRVLWANCATAHCPQCGHELGAQSVDEIVASVRKWLDAEKRFLVLAPVAKQRRGQYKELFQDAIKRGFMRARINGEVLALSEDIELDRYSRHDIELVIDRLVNREDQEGRLAHSIEIAFENSPDKVIFIAPEEEADLVFSQSYACPICDLSFERLTPQSFSFNHPSGWCPVCEGLGTRWEVDLDLLIDRSKSLAEGAVSWWGKVGPRHGKLAPLIEALKLNLNQPYRELDEAVRRLLELGTDGSDFPLEALRPKQRQGLEGFRGVVYEVRKAAFQNQDEELKEEAESYFRELPCPACKGQRLRPESRSSTLSGVSLPEFVALTLEQASARLERAGVSRFAAVGR